MVLPSRLLSRGAMGMSCMAGGKPRGLTAVILPGSDLTTGELLAAALARLEELARIAGDAPMSDNSFRRFTFMLDQPPEIPTPTPNVQAERLARRARARAMNRLLSAALGKTTDGCLGVEASSKALKPAQAGVLGEE